LGEASRLDPKDAPSGWVARPYNFLFALRPVPFACPFPKQKHPKNSSRVREYKE
jgi:hypothetical protein